MSFEQPDLPEPVASTTTLPVPPQPTREQIKITVAGQMHSSRHAVRHYLHEACRTLRTARSLDVDFVFDEEQTGHDPNFPHAKEAHPKTSRRSALQDWVMDLTIMQQSVLLAAVRGPDGVSKNHPVKVLLRWYRRSFLISAFDRKALLDPYASGGGSFTGPLHRKEDIHQYSRNYLNHIDELPHHFQLHFMHAAEILGYKHPDPEVRKFWHTFYRAVVRDAHLYPESEEMMDKRLGDNEGNWRAAEEVTAR
jgi:hypothetical protein